MVAVNVVDGVKYGFRLLGYLLAVTIVGFILIAIGGSFAPGPFGQGNPILALIFFIAGIAVIYAGGLGLLYKVIADGVETGLLSANRGGGAGSMLGGSGNGGGAQRHAAGGRGGQQYQGNQAQQYQGGQQPAQGGQGARGQQGARGGNQARNEGGNQPPADWEPGN